MKIYLMNHENSVDTSKIAHCEKENKLKLKEGSAISIPLKLLAMEY